MTKAIFWFCLFSLMSFCSHALGPRDLVSKTYARTFWARPLDGTPVVEVKHTISFCYTRERGYFVMDSGFASYPNEWFSFYVKDIHIPETKHINVIGYVGNAYILSKTLNSLTHTSSGAVLTLQDEEDSQGRCSH